MPAKMSPAPVSVYGRGMSRLAGKVALITGAARGQGAAEARLFSAQGATVYLTDVLTEGRAVADEVGGTFFEHDVTDADQWAVICKEITAEHERIDVLINNAGIFRLGGVLAADRELWDTTIAINQTGVFLGMQSVTPTMIEPTRQRLDHQHLIHRRNPGRRTWRWHTPPASGRSAA